MRGAMHLKKDHWPKKTQTNLILLIFQCALHLLMVQYVRKMIPILHARSSVSGIYRRSRCKSAKSRSTTYTTPVLHALCSDYGGVLSGRPCRSNVSRSTWITSRTNTTSTFPVLHAKSSDCGGRMANDHWWVSGCLLQWWVWWWPSVY